MRLAIIGQTCKLIPPRQPRIVSRASCYCGFTLRLLSPYLYMSVSSNNKDHLDPDSGELICELCLPLVRVPLPSPGVEAANQQPSLLAFYPFPCPFSRGSALRKFTIQLLSFNFNQGIACRSPSIPFAKYRPLRLAVIRVLRLKLQAELF